MTYTTIINKTFGKATKLSNNWEDAEAFAKEYCANGKWDEDVISVTIEYITNDGHVGTHFTYVM